MKFANSWRAENSGPGAITIRRRSACSWSCSESTPAGSSTHKTNPPRGDDTRVPSGNCIAIALDVARERGAQPAEMAIVAAAREELGDRHAGQRGTRERVAVLQPHD